MGKTDGTRLDELLDWLADEVAARLQARGAPAGGSQQAALEEPPAPPAECSRTGGFCATAQAQPGAQGAPEQEVGEPEAPAAWPMEADEGEEQVPEITALPSHAATLLGRLAIGLLVAVVLINIPLSRHGAALARMIPSSAALVIRNGLLVKESDKPDVYVYEDGEFRWITDLQVFEHYRYRWENVHEVAPGFLADYKIGRPVYLIAKCPDSPHIYRLENGAKRWIVDIPTFEAEGYQWEDVQFMDCHTLASLPMGETIPPGRGPAPQPD